MAMDSTETGSVPGAEDYVILIVDDDERTSRLERFVLEEEGFTVACVGSGEEALETLPTTVPSLILLDIGLPQMDGFMTCQKIRETSQVPIIMVTGAPTSPNSCSQRVTKCTASSGARRRSTRAGSTIYTRTRTRKTCTCTCITAT